MTLAVARLKVTCGRLRSLEIEIAKWHGGIPGKLILLSKNDWCQTPA